MIAVIQAYDWWETGQCAEWWGADPEWWLVEATRFYHRAIETARAAVDKLLNPPKGGGGGGAPPPLIGRVVKHERG